MTQLNATPEDLAILVLKKLQGARTTFPQPSEEILSNLFQTLFFTSIKTEEGQFIKVTVTLIDPNNPDPTPPENIVADRWNYTHFKEIIPCTVKNLVKLSKAADPWSSSLAVYYDGNGELIIWGMIDQSIHYQSFLNYECEEGPEQPGLFQTTITGIGSLIVIFDYELIATLKQNVLISNYIDVFRYGQISETISLNAKFHKSKISQFVSKVFPDNDVDWEDYITEVINETLSRILLRIQNYQHGGAILIVNKIKSDLDIKYSISYDRLSNAITNLTKQIISNTNYSIAIQTKYTNLQTKTIPSDIYLKEQIAMHNQKETSDELKGAIRYVSSLSCVDGLVVLTSDLKVKGFGAVIKMKDLPEYIYTSKVSRVNESKLTLFSPNHFGTRHRSMFSYCWNNEGSLGFVVSQDGDIRAIMKVGDKLIMWENIKVQQFIKSHKLFHFPTKK